MSEHGFHVHGPHDHEIEHAQGGGHGGHGANDSMTNNIALFTAVIATVGALFSYMGGATQVNAALYKNNAAIKKTEASNQWNYYQAKSSKQNLSELGLELAPAKRDYYDQAIARYKAEKNEIKTKADQLEAEASEWDKKSDEQMHLHHRWAQSTTVLQVSIALAAITLITRRKWAMWGMYGLGAVGLGLGAMAWLHL